MWWGGFSEVINKNNDEQAKKVLIPMWWGGFSEDNRGSNEQRII